MNIKDRLFLLSNVGSVYYYGSQPATVIDNSKIKISVFDALVGLSGQQLIEVETLAEIDPAIFTEVRNYYQGELSIRLPADQLYDDDETGEEPLTEIDPAVFTEVRNYYQGELSIRLPADQRYDDDEKEFSEGL